MVLVLELSQTTRLRETEALGIRMHTLVVVRVLQSQPRHQSFSTIFKMEIVEEKALGKRLLQFVRCHSRPHSVVLPNDPVES